MNGRENQGLPAGGRGLEPLPSGYGAWLDTLKARVASAQLSSALAVNAELILLYWDLGREIVDRMAAEGWGAKVVNRLSADMQSAFPGSRGFSPRNLRYMRSFAEAYPEREFVRQAAARLPWGHHQRLLDGVKDDSARRWYLAQAVESGWSRNVLDHQIDGDLYGRQGRMLTNFPTTLPGPQSEMAQALLKDPYHFDFLALGPDLLERDLERGLLEQIKAFLLELGRGFAFVGSQHKLEVGGQEYFLDLLFYHVHLHCYVVVELKIEDFKPEFAGKMNFYLSAVDEQLRGEGDNPSIGLILCRTRNTVIVEYALRDSHKPIGVAAYRVSPVLPESLRSALPTPEELASDLPDLALVELRVALERALRRGGEADGSFSLRAAVSVVDGVDPAVRDAVLAVLPSLNAAAHGRPVGRDAAEAARTAVAAMLRQLG